MLSRLENTRFGFLGAGRITGVVVERLLTAKTLSPEQIVERLLVARTFEGTAALVRITSETPRELVDEPASEWFLEERVAVGALMALLFRRSEAAREEADWPCSSLECIGSS